MRTVFCPLCSEAIVKEHGPEAFRDHKPERAVQKVGPIDVCMPHVSEALQRIGFADLDVMAEKVAAILTRGGKPVGATW